jgi:hypothetical protein
MEYKLSVETIKATFPNRTEFKECYGIIIYVEDEDDNVVLAEYAFNYESYKNIEKALRENEILDIIKKSTISKTKYKIFKEVLEKTGVIYIDNVRREIY